MPSRRSFLIGSGALVGAATLPPGCARLQLPLNLAAPNPNAPFTITDAHCHIFNARDLPLDGFLRNVVAGYAGAAAGSLGEGFVRTIDWLFAQVSQGLEEALVESTPQDEAKILKAALDAKEPPARRDPRERQNIIDAVALVLGGILPDEIPLLGKIGLGQSVAKNFDVSAVRPILETLELATRNRFDLASQMADDYPEVQLFTPSLVDYGYWKDLHLENAAAGPQTPLKEQIDMQAQIALLSMHELLPLEVDRKTKPRIHPMAPYNPLRDVRGGHAFDHLRYAVEDKGFVGVKLYPASGFLPTGNADLPVLKDGGLGKKIDDALERFYAYCIRMDLPILCHANNSNGFGLEFGERGGPDGWRKVLERHPDLRICFGHFGHLSGAEHGVRGPGAFHIGPHAHGDEPVPPHSWAEGFARLMIDFPRVYADISNSELASDEEYKEAYLAFFSELVSRYPIIHQRLIYSSDWWMNAMASGRRTFFKTFAALTETPAVFDKEPFLGRNAMAFLGLDRVTENLLRLWRYYDKHDAPLPAWLSAIVSPGNV